MFSFQGTQQNVGLKIWYRRSLHISSKWKKHLPIADDIFSMEIGCFQSIANLSVHPNQPTIQLTNVYLCQDTQHIHFLIMFMDMSSCNHFSSCNHTWIPFKERSKLSCASDLRVNATQIQTASVSVFLDQYTEVLV